MCRNLMSTSPAGRLAWCCLAVSVLAGCGGEHIPKGKGAVAGVVTLKGTPFSAGAVRFTSESSESDAFGAEVNKLGNFKITDPIPAGVYKVTLSPPTIGPIVENGVARPATAADLKNDIPEKYRSPAKTDKTVNVSEGKNYLTIDFTP
jgi:hypothetical protein